MTVNEIERERERLEPLVDNFVKKSSDCIDALKATKDDNDELIEDCKSIDSKWQQFLAFKNKIDQKIKETDESDISPC